MKKAILLISLVTLYFISTAQDEWTLIHPYPTISELFDTHFNSDQEGWAVGKDGTILYTEDGGDSWVIQHNDPNELLRSVFFIDDSEGWAVGWSSIYHTTDKGNTWERQNRPSVIGDLTDVFFINPDTGWIVGTYRIVLKTTDGGENWTKLMNSTGSDKSFRSVVFTDDMNGCAVGGGLFFENGLIMVTHDGGFTWTDKSPSDYDGFQRVFFLDSQIGWVCGHGGGLLKTMDGGNSWIDKGSNYYNRIDDIYFFDSTNGIFFIGNTARLTFDGGESWDSIAWNGTSFWINRFSSWSYNEGLAVGYAGSIIKTQDGGNTWEGINSEISTQIKEIGFFNHLDGFAITWNATGGDLIRSYDGGYNWEYDTIVPNGEFYDMRIYGSSCYLLNKSSQLIKSTNAGEDWELYDIPSFPPGSGYWDMQFVNDNTGYLCNTAGTLVKTNDGGVTWVDKSLLDEYSFTSLFFINEEKGWLIDYSGKTILRTQSGGNGWTFTNLGEDYIFQPEDIFFINEEIGFATTNEGVLFKTINGGDTWEEFYVFLGGYDSEIYFINENEGWYSELSRIYHTYDGGETWTAPQSFSNTRIYCQFFLDEEKGWIGGGSSLVATYDLTVSINELVHKTESISIFPNPVHNDVEVKLHDVTDKITDVKVFNLQGQKVKHFTNLLDANSFKFNISDLTSGTYIVHVTSVNSENLIKLIVK